MVTKLSTKTDTRNLKRAFRKAEGIVSRKRLLKAIGQRLVFWVDDNFKQEGIEQSWPPLSPNTVANRRKGSSRPLQDTGRLRQSFKDEIRAGEVWIGTRNKVAPIHHEGARPYKIRPRRKKALKFQTADGVRFAKMVNHPGIPERPLLPTRRKTTQLSIRVIEATVAKLREI